MSLSPTVDVPRCFDLEASVRTILRSPWLGVGLTAAAMGLQAIGHVNCDTSWFMTFADKVLDGAVPYVDIADPNPPAAFVVHLAPLAVARLLHLHAEAAVVLFTAAAALLGVLGAGAILRRAGLLPERESGAAFNAAVFALLLVPGLCFAEREHDVLILVLPFLAACAARLRPAPVSTGFAIAAGIAAGLALAFKPYYALPVGAATLCAALGQRRWQLLFLPETLAASATLVVCMTATFVACPAYLATLAIARDVYGAAHEGLLYVLRVPAFVGNVALLAAIVAAGHGRLRDPRVRVTAVASLGFLATYLLQAKGWMNHAYPGLALALIAGAFLLIEARGGDRRRFGLFVFLPACVVAPLLCGATADLGDTEDRPGLTAAVARLAPPHPRIAALAQELGVGHPLVRRLDGSWVGRQNCLWISYAARIVRAGTTDSDRLRHLSALIDGDLRAFAEDVADGHPDVLLVESPALEAWARRQPGTARLFDAFTRAGTVGDVEIWLRRTKRKE